MRRASASANCNLNSSNSFSWQQRNENVDEEAAAGSTSATATTTQANEPCDGLCGQRSRRMHTFYAARQLCDVLIKCGEKQVISAHRVVLAAACEYFDRMFNGNLKEANQREVRIDGIEPTALADLVTYCYTGQVRLEKGNVEAILSGACFLRLEDVIERCTIFMRSQMDASNCLGIRSFADSQGCIKLHHSAHAYTTEHFMDVVQQPEYFSLPVEDVLALLSSDDLNVVSETTVCEAALDWLNHDLPNRRGYVSRLLAVCRLPCLTPEYLTDFVETNSLFREDNDCQTLLKEAMKFHLLPDRRAMMNLGDRARPRKSTVGTMYVIGGMDPNKGALTIESYDSLKNEWADVGRMVARRLQFGVAVLAGKLHLVGGRDGLKTLNTFESWEPTTNTWTQLPPINTPRHGLGVAVLEGVIYGIGGHDGWSYLSTAERYDPVTKTWTYIGEMSQARNTVGVAVLNGRIYAVGGRDSGQCLRTVEYYSPHTNKWMQCAQMTKRRGFVGVGVLHGYIYAGGGLDTPTCHPSSTRLCCVERYDAKADSWSMVANLNVGRDGIGVCALGNLLFSVGGYSGSSYLQLVECYDPINNEWREVSGLKSGRAAACVAVVPRHVQRNETNGIN